MSLSMNWMRQNPVDILKYLPGFLRSDSNFSAGANSCSMEHERIRLQLQDIFQQLFIESATWGLSYWENTLELTPNKGDTYMQRRKRILLKLQSNQTSTVEFMTALAKRYFASNAVFEVEEDNKNYAFRIIADAVSYDIDGLIEAINIYKPAHLAFIIVHFLSASMSLYSGGVVQELNSIKIDPAIDFSVDVADSALYGGGTVQTSGSIKI